MSIVCGGAGGGATDAALENVAGPDYNAAYTAMAWLKVTSSLPDNVNLYNNSASFNICDQVIIYSDGSLKLLAANSDFPSGTTTSAGAVAVDTWFHLAVVRSSGSDIKLYIDGVEVAANTHSVGTGRSSPSDFYIGTWGSRFTTASDTWSACWKAWERALSVGEVFAEMRQQRPVSYESLERFHSFRSDHTTTDLSGKGGSIYIWNSPHYDAQPPIPWDAWQAPSIQVHTAASGGTSVEPGAASLTLTGFAPSLAFALTPGAASLTTTGYAPSLALSVTPSPASLALTGFAPTVDASGNVSVVPDAASLTLTGYAPLLAFALTPSAASLTLTGFAPSLGFAVTPSPAALTLTGYAPALNFSLTPGTASLTLTGYAPSVVGEVVVEPGSGSLVLTGYAPTVTFGASPIISYGNWSSQVDILPGEEWTVTLAGPSADAPRVRVVLRFTRLTI